MFDIRKRTGFQTVGELRALLNHLPASTRVTICGDGNCFYHEDRANSIICLDCEDLDSFYRDDFETMLAEESPEERDNHLESLWLELTDIPINPQTETLEAQFYIFNEGTHKEDIWRWFDQHHSIGVAYLLGNPISSEP